MYSIRELSENLEQKLFEIGLDPKIKSNPAFETMVFHLDLAIHQANILNNYDLPVKVEDGVISFEQKLSTDRKSSISIFCSSPETFRWVAMDEKDPFLAGNGESVKTKSAYEQITTYGSNGEITVENNSSMLNSYGYVGQNRCNNSTSREVLNYNSQGVMMRREYTSYPDGELSKNIDYADANSMLFNPRYYNVGMYDSKTIMERETFDTAGVFHDDTITGFRYRSIAKLNSEHGLRDLNLGGGYNQFPSEVEINPLGPDEIENLINKDESEIVRAELKRLAQGRGSYYYNSSNDPNFVYIKDDAPGVRR